MQLGGTGQRRVLRGRREGSAGLERAVFMYAGCSFKLVAAGVIPSHGRGGLCVVRGYDSTQRPHPSACSAAACTRAGQPAIFIHSGCPTHRQGGVLSLHIQRPEGLQARRPQELPAVLPTQHLCRKGWRSAGGIKRRRGAGGETEQPAW